MPQQENFAFSTQERTSQTESPTTYCYHKQLQASQRIALFIELRATVWCTRGWWQNWDVVDCVVYCHQYAISFHISIPHTPKMSPTFSHQHFLDAKLLKYFFGSLGLFSFSIIPGFASIRINFWIRCIWEPLMYSQCRQRTILPSGYPRPSGQPKHPPAADVSNSVTDQNHCQNKYKYNTRLKLLSGNIVWHRRSKVSTRKNSDL